MKVGVLVTVDALMINMMLKIIDETIEYDELWGLM